MYVVIGNFNLKFYLKLKSRKTSCVHESFRICPNHLAMLHTTSRWSYGSLYNIIRRLGSWCGCCRQKITTSYGVTLPQSANPWRTHLRAKSVDKYNNILGKQISLAVRLATSLLSDKMKFPVSTFCQITWSKNIIFIFIGCWHNTNCSPSLCKIFFYLYLTYKYSN